MVKRKRLSPRQRLFSVLIHLQLLLVVFIVLVPVLWIVSSSLSTTSALSDLTLIPKKITLNNYIELFTKTNFKLWYMNTLIVALLTMVFTALVNIFTAFIFARYSFKGRKPLLMFVMLFQMFPSFLGLTALYVICLNFNLLNNIYTLVIIYVAGSIPGNIFLARGYLLNLPRTLDEAAYIDGATKWQVFIHVILPLATPIIAFIAMNAFIGPWLDYILPRMLLSANEKNTVALGLYRFVDNLSADYNVPRFAAASLIIAVPIALFQMIFQRFLVTGVTAGANKGE